MAALTVCLAPSRGVFPSIGSTRLRAHCVDWVTWGARRIRPAHGKNRAAGKS